MLKTTSRKVPLDLDVEKFAKPQGAPRGLLLHYILFRIYSKPSHGYEILQDIEEKTEGAWRPGPGSIYPLLRKLVSIGYIEAESRKRVGTAQKVYRITPIGADHVKRAREAFGTAGQKWRTLSKIFIEMLEPKDIAKFFVDGSRSNFEITRDTLESKLSAVSLSEAEYILKEYALNLQRQLDWTSEALQKMQKSKPVSISSKVSR